MKSEMRRDYSKYVLNKREKLKFFAVGYLFMTGIAYLFYMNIFVSSVVGLSAIFFEKIYADYLNRKRQELINIQFKDLLYSIGASMSVGRGMAEALKEGESALRCVYEEDTPMRRELMEINRNISENNGSEQESLIDFAERSGVEDIRNFVEVYISCRETGGDMQRVIENTVKIIMDKMNIKKEIKTLMAQKQFEAKIVSVIPILIIVFLNMVSPDYLAPMYNTIPGKGIMTCALIGLIASAIWIERLMEVD